jgi:chaperone modulatory protein CbpM
MIIAKPDFLERARLDRQTLDVWIEEEWLIPTRSATELAFSEVDLARAELIRDLTRDLGVNDAGVGVILNLVDQVHGLRKALADVLRSMRERSARSDAGASKGEDQAQL